MYGYPARSWLRIVCCSQERRSGISEEVGGFFFSAMPLFFYLSVLSMGMGAREGALARDRAAIGKVLRVRRWRRSRFFLSFVKARWPNSAWMIWGILCLMVTPLFYFSSFPLLILLFPLLLCPFFLPPPVSMGGAERGPLGLCPWLITLFSGVLVSFRFSSSFALLFYLF